MIFNKDFDVTFTDGDWYLNGMELNLHNLSRLLTDTTYETRYGLFSSGTQTFYRDDLDVSVKMLDVSNKNTAMGNLVKNIEAVNEAFAALDKTATTAVTDDLTLTISKELGAYNWTFNINGQNISPSEINKLLTGCTNWVYEGVISSSQRIQHFVFPEGEVSVTVMAADSSLTPTEALARIITNVEAVRAARATLQTAKHTFTKP